MTSAGKAVGLTLDTGALVALERGERRIRTLLQRAVENRIPITVPAGVVAQAWRGGQRQARIARLLGDPAVTVATLDELAASAVGVLCGRSGHADVVVTSDPDNLRHVDPSLRLIVV